MSHVLLKRGIFWYQRRIPRDVVSFFPGRSGVIRKSLKTRDPTEAAVLAARMARGDDAYWAQLRGETLNGTTEAALSLLRMLHLEAGEAATPGIGMSDEVRRADAFEALEGHFKRTNEDFADSRERSQFENISWDVHTSHLGLVEQEALRLLTEPPVAHKPNLTVVLGKYLETHDKGSLPKFRADATRPIDIVVGIAGDLDITLYARVHAELVVKTMVARGSKTATVRRSLKTIVAVFNFAIKQLHIDFRNPFEKFKIAKEGKDAKPRVPFTLAELKLIGSDCHRKDDAVRHIAAMLLDTGARLAEIVGLRASDVFLEGEIPHILIRPHEALGRTLKTPASERPVPLIGEALWAARRAMGSRGDSGWLFPTYAESDPIRTTTASGTLNKWLRATLGISKTAHSFRHSMHDRLRDADVPEAIVDVLQGWGTRSVGQQYGAGYTVKKLHEHLVKVQA